MTQREADLSHSSCESAESTHDPTWTSLRARSSVPVGAGALRFALDVAVPRAYHPSMLTRFQHAVRFALTTLIAVYAVGVASELIDVYLLGDVAEGLSAAATFQFNEEVWRWLAGGEAVAVLLLRLGDVNPTPPSWLFAWILAVWLAIASVATTHALEERRWLLALVCAATALVVWLVLHRRIPGWPGPWRARPEPAAGAGPRGAAAGTPERELL
jgi:hypothetical protein